MGHNGVMEMMAQQLGLAMIPRWPRRASGLISGTTSGTCGSRRNAEELSMTVAPARTASGAKRFEVPDPAEKSASCTPSKPSSVSSRTGSSRPRNLKVFPAERADANSRSSASGNARSSRQRISSIPTAPVAPTIATTAPGPRPSDITSVLRLTNDKGLVGLVLGILLDQHTNQPKRQHYHQQQQGDHQRHDDPHQGLHVSLLLSVLNYAPCACPPQSVICPTADRSVTPLIGYVPVFHQVTSEGPHRGATESRRGLRVPTVGVL